jgi:ribosomal protein L20A (L18A)
MKFSVYGKITLGKLERKFTKEIEAPSESAAKQKIYGHFGSVNGLNRKKVNIEKIEKAK